MHLLPSNQTTQIEQAESKGVAKNTWGNACRWGLGAVGLYHCDVWGAFTVVGGFVCAGGYYVATNMLC